MTNDLSDEELSQLNSYLFDHCAQTGAASIEVLDGLLSAVICCPEMILPSEWMPLVWGPSHQFADLEQAQQWSAILMRFYNSLVARISRESAQDPQQIFSEDLPHFAFPGGDDDEIDLSATEPAVGAPWALGFLVGQDLREQAWQTLCDDWEGLADDLGDIEGLLAGLAEHDRRPPMTLGDRLEVMASVPSLLHEVFAQRLPPEPIVPVRRQSPKVGRNDPCPCGSGRKYKQCHGAN